MKIIGYLLVTILTFSSLDAFADDTPTQIIMTTKNLDIAQPPSSLFIASNAGNDFSTANYPETPSEHTNGKVGNINPRAVIAVILGGFLLATMVGGILVLHYAGT